MIRNVREGEKHKGEFIGTDYSFLHSEKMQRTILEDSLASKYKHFLKFSEYDISTHFDYV